MKRAMDKSPTCRIVIIGAGFGGINAARSLARVRGVEIILIDRNNYCTFTPLLYQVAAAQLEPALIAYPIRNFLRRASCVRFVLADVQQIDLAEQILEVDGLTLSYDFLILATGARYQFGNISGAQDYALPVGTLEEAINLRNHILHCFEQAACESDFTRRLALLSFAIVGGGPTGIEVAGALVELIQSALVPDYPRLDFQNVKVTLVQSDERLLADFPKRLCDYTLKQLRRMGVQVYLRSRVKQVTPDAIYLSDGTAIATRTTIWTAGVEAAPPHANQDLAAAAKGKLVVQSTLQLPDHPQVYVIGDLAFVETEGRSLAGVAPEALQQGNAAAQNIKRQLRGLEPKPFRYFDKGRAAIIGSNTGVACLFNKLSVTGFPAWLLWLGIHLFYLPGIRNRLFVLMNWIYNYLFQRRATRLILPK